MKRAFTLVIRLLTIALTVATVLGTDVMIVSADTLEVWDGTTSQPILIGGYYQISNGRELAWFAQKVNSGSASINGVLTKDIYLNDISDYDSWRADAPENIWTPIASGSGSYTGIFDGKNHVVYGIYTTSYYHGLFNSSSATSTIKNITLSDSLFIRKTLDGIVAAICCTNIGRIENCILSDTVAVEGYGGIGGICMENSGTITNCTNRAKISGYYTSNITSNEVGGICTYNSGTISNCTNYAYVSNSKSVNGYIGGIAGKSSGAGKIIGCRNHGEIYSAGGYVGGIVGWGTIGTIENCVNFGDITSSQYWTGGIVGYGGSYSLDRNIEVVIKKCCNYGCIKGNGIVGGVCGKGHHAKVIDCFNNGRIEGNENVAGIVGAEAVWIENCYNIGSIMSNSGGREIGYKYYSGQIINCYYLFGCGAEDSNATPLSSYQMKQQSSFVGFDFNSVWTMAGNPNYDYPELIDTLIQISGIVTVTGTAKYGFTLTAKTEIQPDGAVYTYQWLRNGAKISGAVSKTYKLTEYDSGQMISVRVTGTNEYSGSVTSTAVKIDPIPVTGVNVAGTAEVTIDKTVLISAEVLPAIATDKTVVWSSGSVGIAQVSSGGVVTGKATGTADITVTTNDGNFSAVCKVTVVKKKISDAVFTAIPDQIFSGTAITPKVIGKYYGVQMTENTDFMTEYQNNAAIGEANVQITGVGKFEGSMTLHFEIYDASVKGIVLDNKELSLTYKSSFKLNATVTPDRAENKSVTWKSSNEKVAIVDANGNVTAKGSGTATITATTEDGGHTASCTVTVRMAWWQWLIKILLFGWIWY